MVDLRSRSDLDRHRAHRNAVAEGVPRLRLAVCAVSRSNRAGRNHRERNPL